MFLLQRLGLLLVLYSLDVGYFTLIMFLTFHASASTHPTLPAPTNVTVFCHNFTNILYWNFSMPDVQPEFIVTISSYEQARSDVMTSYNFLDITNYTLEADATYMLSVEAHVNGFSKSSQSEDVQFSPSTDFSSEQRCTMDFPAINATVTGDTIHLYFLHPFTVYEVEALNDIFEYSANEVVSKCYPDGEGECEVKIHYVKSLHGRCINMELKGTVNGLTTETSKEVCGPLHTVKMDEVTLTCLVSAGVIILMLVGLGASLLYRKVMKSQSSQSSIINKLMVIVRPDQMIIEPERPHVSQVKPVGHTPLLEDDNTFFPTTPSNPEVTHLPMSWDVDVESTEEQQQEEEQTEDDAPNDSGYDCGKFPIEMFPGETVEAYGPRCT